MKKYSLPPKLRGEIEYHLEHYYTYLREIKAAERDMLPSNTPKYSADPAGHAEAHRTTEDVAIKILSDRYIAKTAERIIAIEHILGRLSKEDFRLVELAFLRGTHTIAGAGLELNMSQRTAYRHVDAILTELARELGLIP